MTKTKVTISMIVADLECRYFSYCHHPNTLVETLDNVTPLCWYQTNYKEPSIGNVSINSLRILMMMMMMMMMVVMMMVVMMMMLPFQHRSVWY